jgi:hypothetical protein
MRFLSQIIFSKLGITLYIGLLNIINLKFLFFKLITWKVWLFLIRITKKLCNRNSLGHLCSNLTYVYELKKLTTRGRSCLKNCKHDIVYTIDIDATFWIVKNIIWAQEHPEYESCLDLVTHLSLLQFIMIIIFLGSRWLSRSLGTPRTPSFHQHLQRLLLETLFAVWLS